MKYWRNRNTSKALAKNVGTKSGAQARIGLDDPTTPSFTHMAYVGMTVTIEGRKMVEMSSRNRKLRPGKRNRAKPYATRVHETSTPTIPTTAMKTVLNNSRG